MKDAADDGRADRLAPWIRAMDLEDQLFITSATLVLEKIRVGRDDLPVPFDEADLREGTPASVYRHAEDLSKAYAAQPPHLGGDGVDEHWRISNLAREVHERVARYHPEVLGAAG